MHLLRRNWSLPETKVLLMSWKNNLYLYRFLKKRHAKFSLCTAICKDMHKAGYKRSLSAIMHKMKNFRRKRYWLPENKSSSFSWKNEFVEIMKMEQTEHNRRESAGAEIELSSMELYEQHLKINNPETIEVPKINFLNEKNDLDLSPIAIKHTKSEVPNIVQMSMPQLSGNNCKKSTDAILLKICRELESSNRQLEENDKTILELFQEQNSIFKKQTELILNLL